MAILVPGSTCWKKVRARHVTMIQDGGPAFAAIASALEAARRSIFILGWDVDSRTPLRPEPPAPGARDARAEGDAPLPGSALLPLLCGCLQRQSALHVFILIWDYAVIYAFEREPRARAQFEKAHARLHFALDGDHASGASHHQKVVVIDDEVAFVGGLDLTMHRWDEPRHLIRDPRRIDGDGHPYDPFHDVHAAVAGPAAAALGELARGRWNVRRRRARPPALTAATAEGSLPAWPAELTPDVSDVEVAFARTHLRPDRSPVKEVEALTMAALAAARRWIYAENQYLTSNAVVRALARRLAEEDGPEIVIVLPEVESGWMERGSMGVLRARALAFLRAKDLHGRLRLVSPRVSEGAEARAINVHGKVLVIDDVFAKIGSSNFSNRSMGLDTECDLAVEAYDETTGAFVASVRNRLLGEHLDLSAAEVAARLQASGSLLAVIDQQVATAAYGLVPLPEASDAPVDLTVFEGAVVDPEEPWSVDAFLSRAVPVSLRRRLARRWLRPLVLVVGVLAAATLLWQGPLRDFHLGASARELASRLAHAPAAPLLTLVAIVLAGALFVPITLLGTTTLAVFGAWPGIPVVWAGSVLSAMLSHTIGWYGGARLIRWLPGRVEGNLRRLLRERAFWTVVFMRLLPVGNFGALNLLAGAFRIPRRSFALGNLVGMAPGLLGLGVFVDRARAALGDPSPFNLAVAAVVAVMATVLTVVLKRRLLGPRRGAPIASALPGGAAVPPGPVEEPRP